MIHATMKRLRLVAMTANRNSHFLLHNRRIFVRSSSQTKLISERIRSSFPGASKGTAFVAWPLNLANAPLGLVISAVGRFGNSVIQVMNSSILAQHLSSSRVYYFQFEAICNKPAMLTETITLSKIDPWRHRQSDDVRILWKTDAIFPSGSVYSPCGDIEEKIRVNLSKAIGLRDSNRATSSESLTIHLRSGDVFGTDPHPAYGQPPWVFYLRVLELRKWNEVIVISEDSANPNMVLIEQWCEEQQIKLRKLGSELREALKLLASAENVVLSRGTFSSATTFLGSAGKNVYVFEHDKDPLLCDKRHALWNVRDLAGTYKTSVYSRNWGNTEYQRELMLHYPKHSVSLPALVGG